MNLPAGRRVVVIVGDTPTPKQVVAHADPAQRPGRPVDGEGHGGSFQDVVGQTDVGGRVGGLFIVVHFDRSMG